MRILLYKGKSLVSKLIQFQTRSKYSHVAVQTDDGVYEAWQRTGVRRIDSPFAGHKPGTEIDVYIVTGIYDQAAVLEYLESRLGNKYDYLSVLRFVTRRTAPANKRDFCAEYGLFAFAMGGLKLLRGNYSEMSPRDISISPLLVFEKTIGSTD